MRTSSLSIRLLIAEGLLLAILFALVSYFLEKGFRESAEEALREKLQIQVYSLLSAAKLNDSGKLIMPPSLHEPRFENPGSGLYGFILQPRNKLVWRSPSAIGLDIIPPPEFSKGNSAFSLDKHDRYVLHYAVIWQNVQGVEREYIFSVAEDARFVNSQVEPLQKTLIFWLSIIGVVLVFIQFIVLRWSLNPLWSIVKDLKSIELGKKTHLDGHYAKELDGLAGNLNAFITHERAHLERYRNNLADLAHSLKTPLAILRGCIESFTENKETVQEQISRMNEIIEYQLQRAAAKGEINTIKIADLTSVIRKIHTTLDKVYIDKQINFNMTLPEECLIYCEEGDLYEIVGNLMDNACKWCRHNVKISITLDQRKNRRDFSVLLKIEDDGPGIPVGKFNDILKRGIRADENIDGHGIGMAVVYELIGLLGGELEGGKSVMLGGMRWSVYLP